MNKWLFIVVLLSSCTMYIPDRSGTFGSDRKFLLRHDSGLVVLSHGDAQVLVSPKYQGKVFTSTAAGDTGMSFGWIHYKAFDGPVDSHMNAYGGENRLWLGPEGGRFSLFFPAGAKMVFANWKTPPAFDTEPWKVVDRSDSTVRLEKDMQLTNYAGTPLRLSIDRSIAILSRPEVEQLLSLNFGDSIQVVGYATVNTLINTGDKAWTDGTGMPCIWMLDMLKPSSTTTIIIPYRSEQGDTSKPATTDYFGEIPADRIKYENGIIFFTADGKSRGKLGVHPTRAKETIGSYDAENRILTIAQFDIDNHGRYLNQEWNTVKPTFSGDAVNAYNDGPLADGSQMGPFFELESVAPAVGLGIGEKLTHHHCVFHFTGPETALDSICKHLLGASIGQVKLLTASGELH